ncbi:DUF4307 domain-containing protein [Microbacterium terricola]|uniref:Transcriptional regulator n=1 Tax=Microbacterium terricola TaxID=344163 RepID=A0ABM8DZW1_9MICO|nr:DUF4307 domain-containing protein [Microbacterium terricola]UYK41157.1 DUF4307 domain-containing protein [Microbacterium terricola]BDV31076.1 hypothetical protein Microterr_17360 [Microbacterium terricola]
MTTTQQMLDERYGRHSARRRRWTLGIIVGVAAVAVGLFAWMTVAGALDDVDVDATGFHVVDERTVTIDFQFIAPPGRSVACALEAQDTQHGIVGWRVVEYPASDEHSRAFQETVPTVAEATTGFVNSCWVT